MTAKRWGAPLAVAIVIALVAGVAVWLARGSSTPGRPTVLHLGSATGGTPAMAAAIAAEPSPPGEAGQQPYELIGTLPDGQPPDAAVYRLPKATADDAASVARALHLDGTPVRAQGGWVLRNGTNRLAVLDDGSWSYGLDCFSGPEAREELTVECAFASAGTATAVAPSTSNGAAVTHPAVTPPPPPTEAAQPEETTPHVGGLLVANWTQWLVFKTADGSIESGNGWAVSPQRGASYPLITAQRAFELLQEQPRPMVDMCRLRPDGKPGCAPIAPSQVTGATLGLMLDYDAGEPVLVPAWLFAVKGQDLPVAQVAVEPSYLAPPSPAAYPTVKGVAPAPPVPAEPPQQASPVPARSESPE